MSPWTVPVALVIVVSVALEEICLTIASDGMVVAVGAWDSSFGSPAWSKG